MEPAATVPDLDLEALRSAIQDEYTLVATRPQQGFHFHTGRPLTALLDYEPAWLEGIPEASIESFAGTGNPFRAGPIRPGERVVDAGCGAGLDSLVAARIGAHVVGVDMTPAMLEKARGSARQVGYGHVEFRAGHLEELPVEDGSADVVISNGVLNLCPDKTAVLREFHRVLRPGGRLQIGDIAVQRAVPEGARRNIDLWTG